MRILLAAGAVLLAVFLGLTAWGWSYFYQDEGNVTVVSFTDLARSFEDGVLRSRVDPAVEITLDPSYDYLGGQKFLLRGAYAVEQHIFVVPNPDGSAKRLVCFQFEGILPQYDGAYDYSAAPQQRALGDVSFYVDSRPGSRHPVFPVGRPGSDGYQHRKFAADNGYKVPADYVWARYAYVPESNPKRELLIVFYDDLSPTGFAAEALREGGDATDQTDRVVGDYLDVIDRSLSVSLTE